MTSLLDFKRILSRHQQTYPVGVIPIANELGINVYKVGGFPDNISGRIYRSKERGGRSGYAIDVNGDHSDTRRRFTIAHEIAHYLLHRDQIGDQMFDDYLYRSGLSNALERQANRLAADILMPYNLINQARADGYRAPSDLARAFNVSDAAMAIRLGVPA